MTVEAEAIRKQASLQDIVGKETTLKKVATTGGGEYAGPCPFCGGDDRFRLQLQSPPGKKPDGSRWMCRQCSPRWGDVIGFVEKRRDLDFLGALNWLADLCNLPRQERVTMPEKEVFNRAEYERMCYSFIEESACTLWTDTGKKALEWLHARGLTDGILKTWAIGFNPEDAHYTPRGIVIPCIDDAGLHYVKVRRAAGKPKYKIVKGGEAWPFGMRTLKNSTFGDIQIAFLLESELDALLGMSTGLDGVGYFSIPAGARMHDEYLPYLHNVDTVIVAFDADEAGQKNADNLCKIPGFYKAQPFPEGKDLTEYNQAGGDVLEYLLTQLETLQNGNHSG
jgi:DNA primase